LCFDIAFMADIKAKMLHLHELFKPGKKPLNVLTSSTARLPAQGAPKLRRTAARHAQHGLKPPLSL